MESNLQLAEVKRIFSGALEQPDARRGAFLDTACGDNQALRQKVDRMLVAHSSDRDWLKTLTCVEGGEALFALTEDAPPPERIGRYRIKRLIASGGMGVVYEAEQDSPLQTLAVKVMRRGLVHGSAVRRFEYESRLLARLQHPGIARVYEAGTHQDDGGHVPYFAMEYVSDAQPVTAYAKARDLGPRARLELFAQVCDAVHHGHQKGVIHRDLKPANILVDGDGRPKIIDFGVARSTDADIALTTMQTSAGQLVGTLQYMSPEQCRADPDRIDTRSDVYALGAVLYEMLCGKPLHDISGLCIPEATRAICERQPSPASAVDAGLRGDIDTILLKAVEKQPERRYQSVLELSQDIRRYLRGEAILARTPSVIYQLRVFARRNKVLVGAAAAVVAALAIGVIGTSYGLIQSNRQRDEAEAVVRVMTDALRSVDPRAAEQYNPAARRMLDEIAKRIENDPLFAQDSLAEADLRTTIGIAYHNLVLTPDHSLPHLRKALEIRRRILGDRHPDLVPALYELARAETVRSNLYDMNWQPAEEACLLKEAEALYREAVDLHRSAELPDSLIIAGCMRGLAGFRYRSGDLVGCEDGMREALALAERLPADDKAARQARAREISNSLVWLGFVARLRKDSDAAIQFGREALALRRQELDQDDPDVVEGVWRLGWFLKMSGDPEKFAESEELHLEAIELGRQVYGNNLKFGRLLHEYASLLSYRMERDDEEVLPLYREGLSIKKANLAPDHPLVAAGAIWLRNMCEGLGRKAEAESILREALEDTRAHFAGLPERLAEALLAHGLPLLHWYSDIIAAEPLYREALQIQEANLGDEHPDTLRTLDGLGNLLVVAARYDEAVDVLSRTVELRRRVQGEDHSETLYSMALLADALRRDGRLADANETAREALERARLSLGDEHATTATILRMLGLIVAETNGRADAEPLLREAVAIRRKLPDPDLSANLKTVPVDMFGYDVAVVNRKSLAVDLWALGALLCDAGEAEQAEPLLREALEGAEDPRRWQDTIRSELGECLTKTGKYDEAEKELTEVYEFVDLRFGKSHPLTRATVRRLVDLYDAWQAAEPETGYDAKAAEWRAKLDR